VAYRIVTPYSSPTFSAKDTNRKNVKWLPNVPQRKASEVRIFFARAGILDSEWRKHFPADIVDVGSVALENGETVWAIYRVIDLPDFTKLGVGHGYRLKGNTDQQIESAYSEGSPRIICFDEDSDGCRIMYDCAVDPKLIDSLRQKLAAG
jgi:hypothetical protein